MTRIPINQPVYCNRMQDFFVSWLSWLFDWKLKPYGNSLGWASNSSTWNFEFHVGNSILNQAVPWDGIESFSWQEWWFVKEVASTCSCLQRYPLDQGSRHPTGTGDVYCGGSKHRPKNLVSKPFGGKKEIFHSSEIKHATCCFPSTEK